MKEIVTATSVIKDFDSVSDVVQYAKDNRLACNWPGANNDDYIAQHNDWFGRDSLCTWGGIFHIATKGWKEGLEKVEALKAKIKDSGFEIKRVTSVQRRRVWSEDGGDEYDRERMMDGRAYWRTTKRESRAVDGEVRRIVVNVTGHASRSAESLFWKGLCTIVLSDLLEGAGYRVEISAVESGNRAYTDNKDSFLHIKVKEAGDDMSMADVASALSPWFFRTVLFLALHSEGRNTVYGLGGEKTIRASSDPEIKFLLGEEYILIDDLWDIKSAIEFLNKEITQVNEGVIQDV